MTVRGRNGRTGGNAFDSVNIVFLCLLGFIVLYPFYNSVLISFTPESVYVRTPFLLYPKAISLGSYNLVFKFKTIFTGYGVTLFITLAGVLYNMLLTVLMAYCFNKSFPGKKFLLLTVLFTMFFNGGLIPYYLLVRDLGLVDSLFSMILPTGVSITYMTVMRKYFAALPVELEESAKLDGGTDITILFRIIIPLAMPMIVTFMLYYGVERWNEWWNGMLFIKDPFLQPLQLVLRNIINSTANEMTSSILEANLIPFTDGVKMASVVVTMAPIMCVYPFLQKYFVQGLAIGAVKG
jgi:putative aldouronate transport system permease protein